VRTLDIAVVRNGLSRTKRWANSARHQPTSNQSIWLEAAKAAEDTAAAAAFADRIQHCKTWRSDYVSILEDFAKLMLATSPANAIQMCHAGLDAAEQAFVFRLNDDDDTNTVPLKEAMSRDCKSLEGSGSQTYKGKRRFQPRGGPTASKVERLRMHGTVGCGSRGCHLSPPRCFGADY
jgi:hypothetical protein